MKNILAAEVIDQEIDFIGQLFVEYEQLTAYPDILISPDKLRSLASLFYDFVERIHQAVKYGYPPEKAASASPGITSFTDNLPGIFEMKAMEVLLPFFKFYQQYRLHYPDKINAEEVIILYHQFPAATEIAAGSLRAYTRKLRS